MTLAEKMIQYRAINRMSQKAFAEKVGVSSQTIYLIENELQNPTKRTKMQIELVINECKGEK